MNSYHRIALIWVVVMVFTLVKCDFVVLAQDEHATLRGLQGVCVIVEQLNPEIEQDGLAREQLQTDIEQKFRIARIKVFSPEEVLQVKGGPTFYLHVNVLKLRSGCYVYNISTKFIERVFPERASYLIAAVTWEKPELLGFNCELSHIRASAKKMVDRFINAYSSVNSK